MKNDQRMISSNTGSTPGATIDDWINSLPRQLAGNDLRRVRDLLLNVTLLFGFFDGGLQERIHSVGLAKGNRC